MKKIALHELNNIHTKSSDIYLKIAHVDKFVNWMGEHIASVFKVDGSTQLHNKKKQQTGHSILSPPSYTSCLTADLETRGVLSPHLC
jgi:hypothetical protein